MKVKKIANSAIYEIRTVDKEKTLLVRRNRFDLIQGKEAKKPLFSSENISNADDVFYNPKTEQAILINTEGKADIYDCKIGRKISKISFGYEMFDNIHISNDSQHFYFIDKNKRVMKLGMDGQTITRAFKEEDNIDRMIYRNGKHFLFHPLENGVLSAYDVKCYEGEKLIQVKTFDKQFRFYDAILDCEEDKLVMRVEESSTKRGYAYQDSFYVFDESKIELLPLFTVPKGEDKMLCIYDFATCLKENLLALICSDNLFIIDLISKKIVEDIPVKFGSAVKFLSSKEIMYGTWGGLYLLEL